MSEIVPVLERAMARLETLELAYSQLCQEFEHLQETVIDLASLSAAGSSDASIILVAKVGQHIETIRRSLKATRRAS